MPPVIAKGGGAAAPGDRRLYAHSANPPPAPRTARRCPIATVAGSASSTTQALHFAESYVTEDLVLRTARSLAHEVGLEAVSPGAGAALRLLAAAGNARAVVEIGTGSPDAGSPKPCPPCPVSDSWSGRPVAFRSMADDNELVEVICSDTEERMAKAVEHTLGEFGSDPHRQGDAGARREAADATTTAPRCRCSSSPVSACPKRGCS